MAQPEGLLYSKEHEWVKIDGDRATVGITDYAQDSLGDIVYVELPKVGAQVAQFGPVGVVESVKAVSDLFTPVGGEVLSALTLAVHAAVPVARLRAMIGAYPTFHRAISDALRDLG